jgi:hypothetical protein
MAWILRKPGGDPPPFRVGGKIVIREQGADMNVDLSERFLYEAATVDYLGTLVHIYDHYYDERSDLTFVFIRPIDGSDKSCATGWVSLKDVKEVIHEAL